MKALVKFAAGRAGMEVRDLPMPEPQAGEVRIRVKAAGICGTDLHSMLDERQTALPVVLGHEFAGIVEKVAADVHDLQVGDWVTALPACYSCGQCDWCEAGLVTLCKDRKSIGTHKDGAMAEYVVCPAEFCYKIPDTVENKLTFAVAEPLACAVRGVFERITVQAGDLVVVSGPGTIGLFVLQCLKARGAQVIVSGLPTDRHRLEKALELGADAVAESQEELLQLLASLKEKGADITVEASGAAPSLATCLKAVKTQGTVLQVGVYGKPVTCDVDAVFNKELTLVGTNSTARSTWSITMKLLAEKKVDLEPIISLQLPLEDWQEGFQAVIDKTAFKVLLIP